MIKSVSWSSHCVTIDVTIITVHRLIEPMGASSTVPLFSLSFTPLVARSNWMQGIFMDIVQSRRGLLSFVMFDISMCCADQYGVLNNIAEV